MHAAPAAARLVRADCDPTASRAAITDANTAGKGKIKLASHCTYLIPTPATATDGLPAITGDVGITGGKYTTIARDVSAADFRLFTVDNPDATLTLKHLTITLGKTPGL